MRSSTYDFLEFVEQHNMVNNRYSIYFVVATGGRIIFRKNEN
jgi:hypothetical protein